MTTLAKRSAPSGGALAENSARKSNRETSKKGAVPSTHESFNDTLCLEGYLRLARKLGFSRPKYLHLITSKTS